MDFEIRDIDLFNMPEDVSVMNPYGKVPILEERDLILYDLISMNISMRDSLSAANACRADYACSYTFVFT